MQALLAEMVYLRDASCTPPEKRLRQKAYREPQAQRGGGRGDDTYDSRPGYGMSDTHRAAGVPLLSAVPTEAKDDRRQRRYERHVGT